MEQISDTARAQAMLIKRRKEAITTQKARTPKKFVAQRLRLFPGFTSIPNNIFEVIISDSNLKLREIKILLLILRLTNGFNRNSCTLRNCDFKTANVEPTHSKKIIAGLVEKTWLTITKCKDGQVLYQIHKDRQTNQQRDPQLTHLICTKVHTTDSWRK